MSEDEKREAKIVGYVKWVLMVSGTIAFVVLASMTYYK